MKLGRWWHGEPVKVQGGTDMYRDVGVEVLESKGRRMLRTVYLIILRRS